MRHRYVSENQLVGWLLAGALCFGSAGCAAKVNQDVYDRDMGRMRSDMAELNARVGANQADIGSLSKRLDDLETALEEMRGEFDVAVTRLENGLRFTTPVHFDFDEAVIRSADLPLLERFAEVVASYYEGALITVEGFADPAGSAAYNLDLSERRALAVASYLEEEGGLFPERLKTVGYGEERQVVPGAQGPGDSGLENRRVTFVIEYAPGGDASEMTAAGDG